MATAATFRADFPEFAASDTYTDAQISFWLSIGANLLDPLRWGNLLDHGLELFTAHHMAMAQQNLASSNNGAPPGQNTGIVSGKTVDKVSITYDTSVGIMENASHFNLSTYGQQFFYLARLVGAGGVHMGGCGALTGVPVWS